MILDKLEHRGVWDFVDVERKSSHRDSDHRLGMIEKLYGFGVEREIVGVFVVKEMNRVLVQFQGQGLQERNVVSQDLFVGKVKFVNDDRVDVIVT